MADVDEVSIDRRSFKFRGRDAFYMTIIAFLGIGIVLLMRFSLSQWGEPFDMQTTLSGHAQEMSQVHSENTYILSVCLNQSRQEECRKLNIQMPDTLRKKMQRRD